jgi:hypothetical protein
MWPGKKTWFLRFSVVWRIFVSDSTHLSTLGVHRRKVDGDCNHGNGEVGNEDHEEEDHADRKVRRHGVSCR